MIDLEADYDEIEERGYLGWLLAGKLAEWLNMEVGMYQSEFDDKPDHYTLVIELPSEKVTVNIPSKYVEGRWKKYEKPFTYYGSYKRFSAVMDCLYGILVSKHVLMIPEKKETTE